MSIGSDFVKIGQYLANILAKLVGTFFWSMCTIAWTCYCPR